MNGDLAGVKEILPYVPEAINELMNEEGDNLLMWYVLSALVYNAYYVDVHMSVGREGGERERERER